MSSRAPRSNTPARSGKRPHRKGTGAPGAQRFGDDPRAGKRRSGGPTRPPSGNPAKKRHASEHATEAPQRERAPRLEVAEQHDTRKPRHSKASSPQRSGGPRRHEDERTRSPRAQSGQGSRAERGRGRGKQAPRQPEVLPERFHGTVVEADAHVDQTFASLGVGKSISQALAEQGAHSPFAIQAATIPMGLQGRDLLVRSHTGSGKTIAFGVAVVEAVLRAGSGKRREFARAPKGLIVAPTRELALQIDRVIQPMARAVGLFTTQVYGGVPQGKQVGALRRGVDIVIGTPGRLEDLIEQGHLDISQVIVTTIDEADHMAELGFVEPVQRLLAQTESRGQRLLFSATLDQQVASLVDQFLKNPAIFELHDAREDNRKVEHIVKIIGPKAKMDTVVELARNAGKVLVFSRTRAGAEEMRDYLEDHDIRAVDLHGDLNQNRRSRNLAQLTSGRVNVLVATDVAARGIHVDDIDLVIQADLPDDSKTYVHRAGRTGRAGKDGVVITLTTNRGQYRAEGLLAQAGVDNFRVDVDQPRGSY